MNFMFCAKQKTQLLQKNIFLIKLKAAMYVKEKGKISNVRYREINNCSINTVTNDLSELIKKKILIPATNVVQEVNYEWLSSI